MYSPYITAIQKLGGQTSGEKYRTLRYIAQSIIYNDEFVHGDFNVQPSEELPEPLIPLVELEIALLLHQTEKIITALQSEDETIFNRALKAKWFFDGSLEHYHDIMQHLLDLLDTVSVHHRMKIIKVLANNLVGKKLTSIGEELYNVVSKLYGHHQARRLLITCSESFIVEVINDHKMFLSLSEVNSLFPIYPDMIIEYLKSQQITKRTHEHGRLVEDYTKFLPKLLKKHSNHFVEIIQVHGSMNLKLKSRYHIELFLKNELDALIKDPKTFLPMLPAEEVMKKLEPQQIAELVEVYFPETIEEFNFDKLFKDIFMYIPQAQQIWIVELCFENAYEQSLLDYPDKLTAQAMRLLPSDERIRQARIKLKTDKQWYTHSCGWYTTHSWRCYLPIQESIPLIKYKISKCKDAGERVSLLTQLIYTCRINNNIDALLDVLKYIVTYKNERERVWKSIFDRLDQDFQLHLLPSEHWDILYDIILDNVDKPSCDYETFFEIWNMIKHRIHFDLIHNQCIADKIKLIIRLNASSTSLDKWNIIKEIPEYERKCLNEFLTLIPTEYAGERRDRSYVWKTTILELVKAIYDFNERHYPKTMNQSEKLSVRNYPWLVDAIQDLFNELNQPGNMNELKLILRLNEPDTLADLQLALANAVNVINIGKAMVTLRRQPEKILKNWEKYYKTCKMFFYKKPAIRFLRACRWYHDIPVKFIEQAIKDFSKKQTEAALIIISTLLDGPSFEQFIIPYLPEMNINNKMLLKKKDPVLSPIQSSIVFLNPPISLNFILRFCEPNYIHYILEYLLYLGKRTPVQKLLLFCDQLLERAPSVRKHIPRLLRTVASHEQLCIRLISFWRQETHKSVRLIIAYHIFDVFVKYPSPKSWENMKKCFEGLTIDDMNVLDLLRNFENISIEYMVDYLRELLHVFEQFRNPKINTCPQDIWYFTEQLFWEMMETGVTILFPEEFHKELLEKYLIDRTVPREILTVLRKYLIVVYIESAGDQLDDRLEFFSSLFTRIVKDKWDEPADENVSFCPANYFVHQLIEDIVYQMQYSSIKSKLIDTALMTFLTLLQPQQEPEFYCNFSFASLYNDTMPWEEYISEIQEILPFLLGTFSAEFIYFIANFLHKLINLFYGENLQLEIIERLMEFDDDNTNSLAAALLLNERKNSDDKRFWEIFRILRNHRHPLVTSTVYLTAHSISDYAS